MPRGAPSSVFTNNKPSFTIVQAADMISGVVSPNSSVLPKFFTFSFLTSNPESRPVDGFSSFSNIQITEARNAMKSWEDIANIKFLPVLEGFSEISFGNYSGPNQINGYHDSFGNIFINKNIFDQANPSIFKDGRRTLVHEIGHAIGLNHPGFYNGSGVEYEKDANYYEDTRQYSLMSYFNANKTGAFFGDLTPAGPQLDDIYAIQRLYGANFSTRTGDTVYGFEASNDTLDYHRTNGNSIIFSVWDAGGIDTFNFSGYSNDQIIDLREGEFSNIGGLQKNVSIAIGAKIENAIGGTGNDIIIGNDLSNTIYVSGGADFIEGGQGHDVLDFSGVGGFYILKETENFLAVFSGGETSFNSFEVINGTVNSDSIEIINNNNFILEFNGGLGSDYIDISNIRDFDLNGNIVRYKVSLNLNNNTLSSGNVSIKFSNVENIVLGSYESNVIGSNIRDIITSGIGNSTVYGNGGDDVIYGAENSVSLNFLYGDNGNDEIYFDGETRAYGGNGNDYIFASSENDSVDYLNGGSGDDIIYAGGGNDIIEGFSGNDVINGGEGVDTFSFFGNDESVRFSFSGNNFQIYEANNIGKKATLILVERVNFMNSLRLYDDFSFDISDARIAFLNSGLEFMSANELKIAISQIDNGVKDYSLGKNYSVYEGTPNGDIISANEDFRNVDGKEGFDILNISSNLFNLTINMIENYVSFDGSGGFSYKNIEKININSENSTIIGTHGHDTIISGPGGSTVYGNGGNDSIHGIAGGTSPNFLYGDNGNDIITSESAAWIFGGNDDDLLIGSSEKDYISGGNGKNRIVAGNGDDEITSGYGFNAIYGGDGNDTVIYAFTKADDGDTGRMVYAFNAGAYIEIGLKDQNGNVFVDRISGVEKISFLDGDLDIPAISDKLPVWTEKPFNFEKWSIWDPISPLIFDLDDDGVETTSLANSNTKFDLIGNGFAIKTGWVGKDDGLLALDINNNGLIDNINELFGNQTTNGFSILSVHDLNADGIINSSDGIFTQLKIWKDENSDGISQSFELRSLTEVGIESISLSFQNVNLSNNGNPVKQRSSFNWDDGDTGVVDDVWFVNSPIISQHLIPDDFTPSIESLLIPTLRSYGVLEDIVYRFETNENFANLVSLVISTGLSLDISEFEQSVENMIMNWTGVDVLVNPFVSKNFQVLKALHGNKPIDGAVGNAPGQDTLLYLAAEYSTALQSMAGKMLVQIAANASDNDNPIFDALSGIYFDRSQDMISGDLNSTFSALGLLASDPLNRDDAMRVSRMIIQSVSPTDPLRPSYIASALTASGFSGGDFVEFKGMLEANGVWRSDDSSPDQDAYGLNMFYGNSAAEVINGSTSRDIFIASSGGDTLAGGDSNDTYIYRIEAGDITISEFKNTTTSTGGVDGIIMPEGIIPGDVKILSGTNPTDIVLEVSGNFITIKNALSGSVNSIEKITFSDGTIWNHAHMVSVLSSGSDDNDVISGDWGMNLLDGGGGDDIIYGNDGVDTISGGTGNDTITGGRGNDIIRYRMGDGHDILISGHGINSGGLSDKIIFEEGINPDDVSISQINDGADILISISDGGSIIVKNGLNSFDDRINSITFSNGTLWSSSEILNRAMTGSETDDILIGTSSADIINGKSGNDILDGYIGNDTLIGGNGDDLIKSGPGNDIIMYNIGDGNDVLINKGGYFQYSNYLPGLDKIMFGEGISVDDVSFYQSSNGIDLIAEIAGSGTFSIFEGIKNPGLASFNFFDGTVILSSNAVISTMNGTSGNDTIFGNSLANVISGNAGDDLLMGGDGGDTYKYNSGDGNDIIHEWISPQQNVSGNDILLFGDGIVSSNVRFIGAEKNADLVLQISDGSKITIYNALYQSSGTGFGAIEQYKFSDGTTISAASAFSAARTATALNDVLWGTSSSNTINALAGDDVIYGGLGVDTINGGDGNDVIDGEGLGIIQFAADVLKGGAGDDWIIGDITDTSVMGEDGNDTIDLSRFANGVTFNLSLASGHLVSSGMTRTWSGFENVVGSAFNDILTGTTGNNILNGNDGNDTITDHGGIDIISGGAGDDSINLFGSSSGVTTINSGDGKDSVRTVFRGSVIVDLGSGNDFIQAGSSYDVIISGSGNDFIITGGGGDLISGGDGIDDVEFFNEQAVVVDLSLETVTYSSGAILAFTGIENVYGSNFDDSISGSSFANRLTGYGGNDTIYGLVGNDFLVGSSGDDALYGGEGSDGLNGDIGNDILDGGSGYDTAYFYGKSKLDFQLATTNGILTISDISSSETNHGVDTLIGMENLYFSDGNISVASPIIMDLNGDGVHLIDKTLSSAFFDFDNDGIADLTGWFSSGDGMLVFDENQNAQVDGINEVSFTNVEGALSDLDGLIKRFDTNDDGIFSDLDLDFSKFGVWQDINGDGIQDTGEYSTLAQLGISSIDLTASAVNQDWQMGENIVVGQGSFVRNGETFEFNDVGFIYDSSLALSMVYEEEIDRGAMLRDSFWSLPEEVTL